MAGWLAQQISLKSNDKPAKESKQQLLGSEHWHRASSESRSLSSKKTLEP